MRFLPTLLLGLCLGAIPHAAVSAIPGPPRDLELIEDLVLGLDPGAPLGTINDVAVDSRGRILVLDRGFDTIHVFDAQGRFLFDRGRSGEAPGEFQSPECLAVGPADRVYVAGSGGRIVSLEADGTPGPTIRHEFQGAVRSMVVDPEGNLFAVMFDFHERRMIHRYDMDVGIWTISFGESYADQASEPDPRIGFAYAVGFVDLDEQANLYYAQMVPQQILVYDLQGRRLRTHAARRKICPPPPAPEYKGEGVALRAPSAVCFSLVCLPGDLWLTVLSLTEDHPDGPAALVDVYDGEGMLRYTRRQSSPGFRAFAVDEENRLYVAEVRNDVPVLVRYRMNLD